MNDTIFALSSGSVPSGVAVIRISGPDCVDGLKKLGVEDLIPRKFSLKSVFLADRSELLDRGLVCLFPGPASFTGEDCGELHLHGGRAVVSRCLEELSSLENFRMAEAGEFSRRAFENGKLDLTEVEGLGDLISANTEAQRIQALNQSGGAFRKKLEDWRSKLIQSRAFLEAEFDFSDEDDVPDTMRDQIFADISDMLTEIDGFLSDGRKGEIVRDGFRVVLTGAPNSGKSSLMNALAGRDIAIVSQQAGTTRDVLECSIDLDGYAVHLIDTAGIRETKDEVESEGIRRAVSQSETADLVIWLSPTDDPSAAPSEMGDAVAVTSKSDLGTGTRDGVSLNTVTLDGLESFLELLRKKLNTSINKESVLITRERHRLELRNCGNHLRKGLSLLSSNAVLSSEEFRSAGHALGKLTGFIDVEDLLDVIFSEFCVGK